jgi:hypothetical protein
MKNQEQRENEKQFILALDDFFNMDDDDDNDDDEDNTPYDDRDDYNAMLAELSYNEELKTLVHRLVLHKDQDDAWQEILVQVALIRDRETVLRVWNKRNREFHWYMVRLICNQLKSKTSHYFRLYRRPEQQLDDNSHNIISIANDIGQGHDLADGYVLDSISNKLTHIDDYETAMDNEMVMAEVNNFINNNLTFYEKEIYKMYYEEELSHVKISKATMIPATSIGNTVRKVLAMIQEHLESVGIVQDNEDNN